MAEGKEERREQTQKISSGSAELDEWLAGGYETDVITTLYGPAGSGKTNLCLIAATNVALQGKKVIFIDTEGGFSVERLKQLTSEEVMRNILLLKPTNFDEQREAFNKLLEELKNAGLIIVDGMTMLYRLELGTASTEKNEEKVHAVNSALARQLRILSEVARKKNIPIIVTNQVYADFARQEEVGEGEEREKQEAERIHMVGGDLLKYWSKCLIELQNLGSSRKKAIMRKHRSMPQKEFTFVINDKGISKAKGFRLF